jgi:YegS/Rv2252/BmrU family lipid kinase
MTTAVIVNPHSASGKTAKQWPIMRSAIESKLGRFEARFTEGAGHATALARELLDLGFDRIIAVGGDGTFSEVANGFIRDDRPIRPQACLGIVPLGTGGDFQRSLGISSELGDAISVLATGAPREIDLGRAVFRGHDGGRQSRYFLNLVSFGMGGEVAARAKNFLSPLGGKTAFLYATFEVFLRYRAKKVELTLDSAAASQSFSILNIAIGNGRFHGGGMHVCPRALLDDGLLDVTVIDYLRLPVLLRDLPVLYSDNIYVHPKTRHLRARRIVAEAAETTRIEVDGEPLGTLPLEVTVLPASLKVVAPHSAILGFSLGTKV